MKVTLASSKSLPMTGVPPRTRASSPKPAREKQTAGLTENQQTCTPRPKHTRRRLFTPERKLYSVLSANTRRVDFVFSPKEIFISFSFNIFHFGRHSKQTHQLPWFISPLINFSKLITSNQLQITSNKLWLQITSNQFQNPTTKN